MRLSHVLLLVVASCLAVCSSSSAPTPIDSKAETLNLLQSDVSHTRRFLRVEEKSTATEERAIDLKKIFDARVFSSSYLNLMKLNKAFRLKMFKKWDRFTMEQIKVAIGEAKLKNPRLARMMVDYVQNHRVYRRVY